MTKKPSKVNSKKNGTKRIKSSTPGKKTEMKDTTLSLNKQPPEKGKYHPRGMVEVIHIWPTIQGEGPYHGLKAVFIRLAGCSLLCPGCDTDYTTDRRLMNPTQIVSYVQSFMRRSLVVITGGEPFRQNIAPLVRLLLNSGYYVQIETNGTMMPEDDPKNRFPWKSVVTVCSPKTSHIHPDMFSHIDYFKYVLDAEHVAEDGLPSSVLGMNQKPARPPEEYDTPIYLQPMEVPGDEEKNTKNLTAVVQSCMTFNYRVCLQLHKILGLE
jgi:7-carboxy-7-deazaguanine synthase